MRQQIAHTVYRFDDVGAWLPVKDQQHRRLAVRGTVIAHVLDAVAHLRQVRQTDAGAVAKTNDQRLIFAKFAPFDLDNSPKPIAFAERLQNPIT